eukprot:375079-Alexandrium_andersonii.AAC.1
MYRSASCLTRPVGSPKTSGPNRPSFTLASGAPITHALQHPRNASDPLVVSPLTFQHAKDH